MIKIPRNKTLSSVSYNNLFVSLLTDGKSTQDYTVQLELLFNTQISQPTR